MMDAIQAMATSKESFAERFAQRVVLAKMTEQEAIDQTRNEWVQVQKWVASDSERPGTFRWMCDLFDLEADAVRKAIKEKRK